MGATVRKLGQKYKPTMSECISRLQNLLNRMPQSLLTGQLKEKPTYRVLCLYSSFVHDHDPHALLSHKKIEFSFCLLIFFNYGTASTLKEE
jgi:hypothetical protein